MITIQNKFKRGDIVFFSQPHSAHYSTGYYHFKLDEPYITQDVFVTDSVTIKTTDPSSISHYIIDSYKLIKIRDYNLRKILN
jgi:hypothetical protein